MLLALGCLAVGAGLLAYLRSHRDMPLANAFRAAIAFFALLGARELAELAGTPSGTLRDVLGVLAAAAISFAAVAFWRAMPRLRAQPTLDDSAAQQREIEALNQELSARLESLSTLAGGVAHDFNNQLTVITGHADLMASGEKSPTRAEHLESIRSAADRATALARQMLAYSGRGHFLLEPTDLNGCIDVEQLGAVPDITFDFALEADLPLLQLAPTQLRQLVEELVRNAIEATVEGGAMNPRVSVRTRRERLDASALAHASFEHSVEPGEVVVLEVEDNGIGMGPDVVERLFEPYYSTRFAGRGLGMAAVQGIARGHGAALLMDSEPGRGTTVRIVFPAMRADAPAYRDRSHRGEVRRLLVLDDETGLLDLVREYCAQLGMEAIVTDDPDEAVETLLTEGQHIDAVLLDYLMPLRTGDEVLAEIREFSAVDVYLTSGFSRGRVDDPELRRELAGFLQKPFTFEDFRQLFAPE